MTNDLISRSAALKALEDAKPRVSGMRLGKVILAEYAKQCREGFVDAVNNVAPADAEYVRHGRWIVVGKTEKGSTILRCSVCGIERKGVNKTTYCRDCGAKMDVVIHMDATDGDICDEPKEAIV